MSTSAISPQQVLQPALVSLSQGWQDACRRMGVRLEAQVQSARSNAERQILMEVLSQLERHYKTWITTFAHALKTSIQDELRPRTLTPVDTAWSELSLVDDEVLEREVHGHRLGLTLEAVCEQELRELVPLMSSLLHLDRSDHERNPLRPACVGRAAFEALRTGQPTEDALKYLCRELPQDFAPQLQNTYRMLTQQLRRQGITPLQPQLRRARSPEGADSRSGAFTTGSPTLPDERASEARGTQVPAGTQARTELKQWLHQTFGWQMPASDPTTQSGVPTTQSPGLGMGHGPAGVPGMGGGQGAPGGYGGQGGHGGHGGQGSPAPLGQNGAAHAGAGSNPAADWGRLVREWSAIREDFEALEALSRSGSREFDSSMQGYLEGSSTSPHSLPGGEPRPGIYGYAPVMPVLMPDGTPGQLNAVGRPLMAPNLIRQHREELDQMHRSALDQMIIEVVSQIFDQVLSDTKVPPQAARAIARLQLPVLRVAMRDAAFFARPQHPVRRLINQLASAAARFEDFSSEPAQRFLKGIEGLVAQILEGDFDETATYDRALSQLQSLLGDLQEESLTHTREQRELIQQRQSEAQTRARIQSEAARILDAADIESFIKTFLTDTWPRVLARSTLSVEQDPEKLPRHQAWLALPGALVLSVQPKDTPEKRRDFLLKLPGLMKDLQEGLSFIDCPAGEREAFFAKLLPAHSQSLKGQGLTPVQWLKMSDAMSQLNGLRHVVDEPVAESVMEVDIPLDFSDEEAQKIGLLTESEIDWQQPAPALPEEEAGGLDLDLDALHASAQPSPEALAAQQAQQQLHPDMIQTGVVYQMLIDGQWRRVNVNWVSPARNFFMFSQGERAPRTISMTSRMLAKLCESKRIRPYERQDLMERSVARARQQLAQLTADMVSRR